MLSKAWTSLQLSYSKIISVSYAQKIKMVTIVNIFLFDHNKYVLTFYF